MKKFALAVVVAVIAAVAASPAMAAKKKKMKRASAQPTVAELNDNGYRFVRDSMPVYWPTAFKMIYYSNPENRR